MWVVIASGLVFQLTFSKQLPAAHSGVKPAAH